MHYLCAQLSKAGEINAFSRKINRPMNLFNKFPPFPYTPYNVSTLKSIHGAEVGSFPERPKPHKNPEKFKSQAIVSVKIPYSLEINKYASMTISLKLQANLCTLVAGSFQQ